MVYDDAEVLYAEVKKDGEELLEEALSVLFPHSVPLTPSTRSKALAGSSKIVAYNTTFFPRWDIIKVPLAKAGPALKSLVLQASDDGKEGYAIMHCATGTAHKSVRLALVFVLKSIVIIWRMLSGHIKSANCKLLSQGLGR